MTIRRLILGIGILIVSISRLEEPLQAAEWEQVAVGHEQEGQAFLVSHLDQCLAILPAHVVGDRCGVNLVGFGVPEVLGHGALILSSSEHEIDVAILVVSGELQTKCNRDFIMLGNFSPQILQRSAWAEISTVDAAGGGTIVRIPAMIEDVQEQHLWLRSRDPDIQLAKGLSGALVSIQDIAAGMLTNVDAKSGIAQAIRIDHLEQLIEPLFSASTVGLASLDIADHCSEAMGTVKGTITEKWRPNAAAAANGAILSQWSVPLHDPNQNPQSLLSEGPAILWAAKPNDYPVDFVVRLAGQEPVSISRFVISTKGAPTSAATPKQIEVMTSQTDVGLSWHVVRSFLLLPSYSVNMFETAPVRARRVKIRIHDNYGDPAHIAFSQIRIF